MFRYRQEMDLRVKKQIVPGKPAANIEDLNTDARWARGFTKAGMAGLNNAQHPDHQSQKKTSVTSCKQLLQFIPPRCPIGCIYIMHIITRLSMCN